MQRENVNAPEEVGRDNQNLTKRQKKRLSSADSEAVEWSQMWSLAKWSRFHSLVLARVGGYQLTGYTTCRDDASLVSSISLVSIHILPGETQSREGSYGHNDFSRRLVEIAFRDRTGQKAKSKWMLHTLSTRFRRECEAMSALATPLTLPLPPLHVSLSTLVRYSPYQYVY